jgi:hypothetical protein
MYLMPAPTNPDSVRLLDEVDDRLAQFDLEREALVDKFIAVYPDKIEEAERDLGPEYFSATDYHPVSYVRASFGMFYQFLALPTTPTELNGVPGAIYQRERIKADMQLQEAAEEIQAALREAMAKLVDHLVETLSPKPDGSKRRFYDSTLLNINDFLDTFAARNLTADGNMSELVDKAKRVLAGVKVDDLRKNEATRDMVRTNFEKVQQVLSGLVVTRSSRAITLVDDDE